MAGPAPANRFSEFVAEPPPVTEASPQSVDPSNRFAEFVSGPAPKSAPYAGWGDYLKDFARTGLQGATLGSGDELVGGVRSLLEGRPYQETRDEERAAVHRFAEQNPKTAIATELGAGLVTPGLGWLGTVAKAPTLAGKVVKAVPLGYGIGAASGVGASESESPADWLNAAHAGGKVGAIAAPALPIAGHVAGKVLRRADSVAQQVLDHEKSAQLYLADKLRAAGLTERQIAAELARGQSAAEFGTAARPQLAELPETIADVTPTTQRTLRGIKVGGEADEIIEPFLANRQAGTIDFAKGAVSGGQHSRLDEDLRLALRLSPQEMADRMAAVSGKRSKEADKLFGAARANSEPFDLSRTLEAYNLEAMNMADPRQRAVLQRAVRFFDQAGTAGAAKGGGFPVDNVTRFHQAKMALDDLINRAEVKDQGNLRRMLTRLKSDLMDDVFAPGANGGPTKNDAYRTALDKYASRSELLNAGQLGMDFARGKEQVTDKMFRALSEGERAAFRAGWHQVTVRDMGGKAAGPTSDYTGALRTPNIASELRTVLPPQAGRSVEFPGGNREKLAELVGREQRISDTARKVLGNSSTAEKAVDAIDIGRLARATRYIKDTGGLFQAAAASLSDALEKMSALKGPRAQYLARKLLSTDPAEQQAFLAQVERTYGKNAVRGITDAFNAWLPRIEAAAGGAIGRKTDDNKRQQQSR